MESSPQKSIRWQQLIQNALPAARVLYNTKIMEYITPVLKPLHWVSKELISKCWSTFTLQYKALKRTKIHFWSCDIMNDPDHTGHPGKVCFLSLKTKINVGKQHLFCIRHLSGTESKKTAGLLPLFYNTTKDLYVCHCFWLSTFISFLFSFFFSSVLV